MDESHAPDFEALIIGTGFGGMGAAIQLRRMGIESIAMIERAADLGGTWYLNHYPGLAVDIPSATYSYSFEPNPAWSRSFAPVRAIARCLTELRRRGARSFEVDAKATDAFVERMRERFKRSVFVANQCTGAHSYYFDQHAEPSIIRPTSTLAAHHRHASFPLDDYHFD